MANAIYVVPGSLITVMTAWLDGIQSRLESPQHLQLRRVEVSTLLVSQDVLGKKPVCLRLRHG